MAFIELTEILQSLGVESLGQFWMPMILWTGLAGIILFLQRFLPETGYDNRYYLRTALLLSLPAGIAVNLLLPIISRLATPAPSVTTTVITIEMPIVFKTVTTSSAPGIAWNAPTLWLGLVTAVVVIGAAIVLIRLLKEWAELYLAYKKVDKLPLRKLALSEANRSLLEKMKMEVRFGSTSMITVPLTFGIMKPTILVPGRLKNDPRKLNMTIRHELIHIRRYDYLLNIFLLIAKAVFWFHPLVHKIYVGLKQYREISCDSAVLADQSIAKKQYAELLYEYSPRTDLKHGSIIGISDSTSMLKKRIEIMKQLPTPSGPNWKNAISALLVTAGLTGMMACTDLQNQQPGSKKQPETHAKGEGNATTELDSMAPSESPLYVIDGEKIEPRKGKRVFSQINPENIKSIEVLKDSAATSAYGQEAENGVIIISTKEMESTTPSQESENPENGVNMDVDLDVKKSGLPEKADLRAPEPVGGLKALQREITYPQTARASGTEGIILVRFVVNQRGVVENPTILRGAGKGLDREVVRAIQSVKFNPGTANGKPVRVQMHWPVQFKLHGTEKNAPESTLKDVPFPDNSLSAIVVTGYGS